MLNGWKTYIVSAGAIVGAIFAVVNGYMETDEALKVILDGAIGITLRHAIGRALA